MIEPKGIVRDALFSHRFTSGRNGLQETLMSYTAPIKDMLFDIEHLANISQVSQMPGLEEAGLETALAVLEECARFNQDVVAPLNVAGDREPSSFKDGEVTTT